MSNKEGSKNPAIKLIKYLITRYKFKDYYKKWEKEVQFLSDTDKIVANRYFRRIIDLGWDVVPHIIKQLQKDPDWSCLALPYITGNAPIKLDNVSNLNELTAYWIGWYDNRNIFHSFYQKWKKEIKNTPHLFYQKLFNSENYKAIINMGWGAVPHIIDQLQKPEEKEPEFLFITLRHAADSNPINPKSIGNNYEMTNEWIKWYKNRNLFQRYLLNWLNETGPLSSTQEMFENRYYKAIINMGRDVIPHIIDQLQKKPEHLFKALKEITGMSIIRPEHAGDLYKMAADCIEWYRLYMLY